MFPPFLRALPRRFSVVVSRRHIALAARSMSHPKVLSTEDLSSEDAKWVALKKIRWSDPTGKERVWEAAERTTRGSSGLDAVAILALLRSQSGAFPPSTIIIEQYRPAVAKYVVELPAGLVDDGETAEQTAIRELEEETGFKAHKVIDMSPLLVSDPGMTNATMKLAIVDVPFPHHLEMPRQKLDPGEFITARIVPISQLTSEFKEYEKKGFVIDARLSHIASGFSLSESLQQKTL